MRTAYAIGCIGLIIVLGLSTNSCRKVGSLAKKIWSKEGVRTVGRYAGGAVLLIGIEELIASDMLDLFKDGTGNPGGEAIIYNINGKNITIEMSTDGLLWHEKDIEVDGQLNAAGGPKGFVAIHSGEGGYFMLIPGKEYAVSEESGKVVVKEIERTDE